MVVYKTKYDKKQDDKTERTKFPRNKSSPISPISTYAMISYLNVMMSPTKKIVKLEMLSRTSIKQSLPEKMIFLSF